MVGVRSRSFADAGGSWGGIGWGIGVGWRGIGVGCRVSRGRCCCCWGVGRDRRLCGRGAGRPGAGIWRTFSWGVTLSCFVVARLFEGIRGGGFCCESVEDARWGGDVNWS